MVGQSISHYKLVAKLGEGGMGVVFKAEDTKLERIVALKFLAQHLLDDEEAKERFLREAKAAAALHHPNVCPVHEIDEVDGKTFISMAFLKGETLEDQIERGPLSLKDALDIARQVADGLQAAHAEGIYHRDIKPANIIISPEGRPTIMDFGLARLTEPSRLTKTDTAMGTVAYMSPEQAQGIEVDSRSDLWSLGCVLYEMVSGQRPFQGQYDQALLYEICHEEPAALTGLRTGVPIELELLTSKCLAKDRDDRYQYAKEIAVDLRTLAEKLKSGHSTILRTGQMSGAVPATMTSAQTVNPAEAMPPDAVVVAKRKLQAVYALAAIATLAFLGLLAFNMAEAPPETPLRRFSFAPDGYFARTSLISPDGKSILYQAGTAGQGSLWLRSLSDESARELAGTAGTQVVGFWSPDSLSIGFQAGRELKRVSINGGDPITLCELPGQSNIFVGGTWSPDGERIVFSSGLRLYEIPARGGEPQMLFDPGDSPRSTSISPHFLPTDGGSHGLAYVAAVSAADQMLAVMDLETGERRELAPGRRPVYSSDGYLIHGPRLSNEPGLRALPFSFDTLGATGQSFPIDETGQAASVALDGTLVYTDGVATGGIRQIVVRNRSGEVVQTIGEPIDGGISPVVSPDGRTVALEIAGDIWVYDLDRNIRTRLTASADSRERGVFWPSSSNELSYASYVGPSRQVMTQVADGSVPPNALLETTHGLDSLDWSSDGQYLIYNGLPGAGAAAGEEGGILYRERGPDGSFAEEKPFLLTPGAERLPQFSPDGRFIAYHWNVSGRFEVYVRPFPPAPGQWQLSVAGGLQPRWSADGNELFYVERGEGGVSALMAVSVSTQSGFVSEEPRRLFAWPDLAMSALHHDYDVFPDGQKIVALGRGQGSEQAAEQPTIRIVQNWYEEFRDRE